MSVQFATPEQLLTARNEVVKLEKLLQLFAQGSENPESASEAFLEAVDDQLADTIAALEAIDAEEPEPEEPEDPEEGGSEGGSED